MFRFRSHLRWLFAGALTLLACQAGRSPGPEVASPRTSVAAAGLAPESTFGRLVAALSEPKGFFQSENVVSNETSYLQVMDAMRRIGVHGGAYIGVGPDQNFSYIAAIKPQIAFMFDIRRDNLLEHLLFKAVFAMSDDRVDYLCTLLAKPAPAQTGTWKDSSIAALLAYVDRTPTSTRLALDTQREIDDRVTHFGIPLDAADMDVVRRYRTAFVRDGVDVQYSSIDNSPIPSMPGWRQLLLETDRSGHQLNYLAREDAFAYIKSMEARNLIVPVTGDVSGSTALPAVAKEVASRGLVVSVFYMSNVEQYLMQNGTFPAFAENVKQLPRDRTSVFIRSIFGSNGRGGFGFGQPHPLFVPGYNSTQILQYVDTFVDEWDAGQINTYQDLTGQGWIGPGG